MAASHFWRSIIAVKLKSSSNIDEVMRALDDLESSIADVALPRALNTLASQADVAGRRKIRDVYKISTSDLDPFVSLKYAAANDLESIITMKGRRFPLSVFKPVRVPGPGGGISVSIKGNRVLVPHAFFTPGTGQRVFARGAYAGKGLTQRTGESFGRFEFGRHRRITKPHAQRTELPINQLYSFAPPDTLANDEVTAAMNDRVGQRAAAVLAREVRAVKRGF